MKIVFMGDSITDMSRNVSTEYFFDSYGFNYTFFIEGELAVKYPGKYEILTKGCGGNRILDMYARLQRDCWNHNPDYISILIGINDVWGRDCNNYVELDRFIKVYELIIDDTRKVLPNVKFLLLEPFWLEGEVTGNRETFSFVAKYGAEIKKLAERKGCGFLLLQETLSKLAREYKPSHYLYDGVHPTVAGAKIISEKWLEYFEKNEIKG